MNKMKTKNQTQNGKANQLESQDISQVQQEDLTRNTESKFDEVKRVVWDACNIFRGSMDAMQYKDFILPILFLKYISDKYEEEKNNIPPELQGSAAKQEAYLASRDFIIPKGSSFGDIYHMRNTDGSVGKLIENAFTKIASANRKKLGGVFQSLQFSNPNLLGETSESNSKLNRLLEKFNGLDLSPSKVDTDIIGDAYMYLVERFASDAGKKAGEFYTPRQVSSLVAQLSQAKGGDLICDPACGSGGLLLEVATLSDKSMLLHGMENNAGTWALCRMNLFLHGSTGEHIMKCDSLLNPALVQDGKLQQFDIVVANPPFSLKNWGREKLENDTYDRFRRGMPPNKAADMAFITHMVESAKPETGRVVVITPHGVLFRGAAEGRIREALIKENILDAVIGLPPNLFQTTSIPVAILIFDKSRLAKKSDDIDKTDNILFIDASQEFTPGRSQNELSEKHKDKIISTYVERKDIKKYSSKVSLKEIEENGYSLNISRYIDTFPEEEQVDIAQVQKEIVGLEKEIGAVQQKLRSRLAEIIK